MKKILTFLLSCMLAATASAMPARPGTFTVTQSDGTVLTLRMVGDEHFHYFLDVNTGRKMELKANGDYAVMSETEVMRRQAAAKERVKEANILRMVRQEKYLQHGTLTATIPGHRASSFSGSLIGERKGLVILVNFADLDHSLDDPQLEWDRAFNEVGYSENGHVGSVHDYFYDQSYGKFDLEFDVVGPVTVSKKMSYYGQNNSYGSDAHPAEMVAEACKLVNNQVNFKDYDWDGDGEVDQVYVIYAGYGESSGAPSETIWPHEYWLQYGYGQKLYLDGVYIDTYACSCELRGSGRGIAMQNGIGTACHEFSHCIGYPDFYDVNYGGCFGMDEWDVMASGGYNGPSNCCEVPAGFTAYERWMAGWLDPIELTEGTEIKEIPCLLNEPAAYILRNKAKGTVAKPVDEYFLIENRQNEKWFSYPKGAHGLLITHVDYDETAWAKNLVNTDANKQRMSIIPAGKTFGSYDSGYKSWYATAEDYRSMLFPGSKNVTRLTNESHYDVGGRLHNRNTDGTYNMNIPLTDITEEDGKFSFVVNGGTDLGYRWEVGFDAGNGSTTIENWKQQKNGESIVLPEAKAQYEGWRFFGWSTSPANNTKTRPDDLLASGTIYTPQADVKFYAVYGVGNDGPLIDEYKLSDAFVDKQKYVLASKDAVSTTDIIALSAGVLTVGTITKSPVGAVINVNFDTAVPFIVAPDANIVWEASVEDGRITLKHDSSSLSISSGGFSLVNDVPAHVNWDASYGLYGTTASGSNYYVHNSNGKFSVSTTKIKGSRVFLYALTDFSDKDVIYTSYPADLTEGIAGIYAPTVSSILYDMQGRRTNASSHGVYIQNGRKVIR